MSSYIPYYIRQSINNIAGDTVTADRWNELWNLSVQSNDANSQALHDLINTGNIKPYGFTGTQERFQGIEDNIEALQAVSEDYEAFKIAQESTNTAVANDITTLGNTATAQAGRITTNEIDISSIKGKIPSAASALNQLADKEFVNSSITTATAYFRGTFNSVAALNAYSGTKTINDYAYVVVYDSSQPTQVKQYDRYKWNGTQWLFEYTLNNSSFTASQWAAINSGITSAIVGAENARLVCEDFDATKAYEVCNKVVYQGSTYYCIQDTTAGTLPTNTTYWLLIAKKGDKGDKGDTGNAATIAVGTVTKGVNASVTNTGTSEAAVFNFVLPKGDKGDKGDTGNAATISVGTVTKGTTASVTNSGTSGNAVFDFVLPKGDTGATGTAATVNVGTVTTGAAGTNASVTNSGTTSAAILNFTIPKGEDGADGNDGISPTISTNKVGKTTTVTVVDADGTKTFNILDGADGQGSGDMLASIYDPTNKAQDIFAFVNSSISTSTAFYIGTFDSLAELQAYTGTITNNDYAYVTETDALGQEYIDRYKYNASTQQWILEFKVNNTTFTAQQLAWLNTTADGTTIINNNGILSSVGGIEYDVKGVI